MNKPRLIDANKAFTRYQRKLTRLIDGGEDRFSDECMKIRAIMSAIEDQPTAYDIDKVVERLEEELERPFVDCDLSINGIQANDREIVACKIGIKYAIEIVRKGGAIDDETMA